MTAFTRYLSSISPLSEEIIQAIDLVAEKQDIARRQILVEDLSRSEYLHFIESGVLRAYFSHKGKTITDWFGQENMIIGPVQRRFAQRDTRHVVEALEQTRVYSVRFYHLQDLYQQFHDVERLGRMIAIQSLMHLQRKLDYMQLMSAAERYRQFRVDYPQLSNNLPLGMIASFLGMNQVTLSRIRKNV